MAEAKTKPKNKKVNQEKFLNERISFIAMKDNDKYKDDIIVTINGTNWQIQRGKKVMIPRFVYFAIEDAERQKMHAADVSEGFEKQYRGHVSSNMM